ncbi:MAG: tetratricopeptide repeat protein, partial [Pseudomonadota bacterium]
MGQISSAAIEEILGDLVIADPHEAVEQAGPKLSVLLEKFPDSSEVTYLAGLCALRMQQYNDAITMFQDAFDKDPNRYEYC